MASVFKQTVDILEDLQMVRPLERVVLVTYLTIHARIQKVPRILERTERAQAVAEDMRSLPT